jgi:hypothetical protein
MSKTDITTKEMQPARNILTSVPYDIHHKMAVIVDELDITRVDLYEVILIYSVLYSKVTIEDMFTKVRNG